MTTYVTGYNGTVRTLDSLLSWSHWQNLDPELGRRVLALLDASVVAGRPLGIGSIFRTYEQQKNLFLSRHYEVATGGCCSFEGKRYALRSGQAHAAPPGRSYHEATTPQGKALALDFVGDLAYLKENAAKYGLIEFSNINNEPWHGQPKETPVARKNYVSPSSYSPLPVWPLPGTPAPAPTKLWAPKPTLRQGAVNAVDQVRALQHHCNFWGWRDAFGRTLLVDGDFGTKTAQAVMSMQRALKQVVDGMYGPKSAAALQAHLDAMTALANG